MARVPSVPRVLIDRARQQAGLVDTAQCEIDGNEFHRTDEHLSRDATRQNGLVAGEHVILRYRMHHLAGAGEVMTSQIRDVLSRAGREPGRRGGS